MVMVSVVMNMTQCSHCPIGTAISIHGPIEKYQNIKQQ